MTQIVNTLFDAACRCIMAANPTEKVAISRQAVHDWQQGELALSDNKPPLPIPLPGQPAHLQLVSPQQVPRRNSNSSAGQIALIHALAHIEFNAINLAWDAIYRFRDMPTAFYADWIQVADEETSHFCLLREALQTHNVDYGDLPAHDGLWEMAVETDYDVLVRMALVPRVLEARGLDATPAIIGRLRRHDDQTLIPILERILRDEIGHVAIGTRWFQYCCDQRGCDPHSTFQQLLKQHFRGKMKQPFNTSARLAAGFSPQELVLLATLS